MPAAPTEPDAPLFPPRVCVCGYDLAGLPPDADAKCPACGVVIAESQRPESRFRHWGRLLAAGMTPAVFFVAPMPLYGRRYEWPGVESLLRVSEILGSVSWLTVSAYAFSLLVVRATRATSFPAYLGAAGIGMFLSFTANFAVIQLGTSLLLHG